jgi:hemerythrin-like domain-containing protein
MAIQLARRNAIGLAAALAAGALAVKSGEARAFAPFFGEIKTREPISPVEDLARQHGVLRRVVNLYAETERRIRAGRTDIDAAAIVDAAKLFRSFGEDWHQRVLEESYVFPMIRKAGPEIEKLLDVLVSQHRRGREFTDYLTGAGARGGIAGDEQLATALGSMARMINAHETFEDTVIFPALREMLPKDELDEMASTFRDMELQAFGKDGVEDALARVKEIEQAAGISGLEVFTA